MAERVRVDEVAKWLTFAHLLRLALQPQQREELQRLFQIAQQLFVCVGHVPQSGDPIEGVRRFHQRGEREHANRVDDRTRAVEFYVELVLVFATALDDEVAKKAERRLVRERDEAEDRLE